MAEQPTHWCWVAPRTRVKRVGSAMECFQCRRFKKKHKCGGRTDAKTATVPYPVEECAHCNPRHPRGTFPEGPSEKPPPQVKPKPPKEGEPGKDRPSARQRRADRLKLRKDKQQRLMLIVLAVSRGAQLMTDVARVVHAFNPDVPSRTISAYLYELVNMKWLTREKETTPRTDVTPGFIPKERWRYTVNPAIMARIEGETER
jgi:hypothetical protein